MEQQELYPELVDYIYHYYAHNFMNDDERYVAGKGAFTSPITEALLANGFDGFKMHVASRIYSERKHELTLNLCPSCGKIARTPLAKQCRFCFYDWH